MRKAKQKLLSVERHRTTALGLFFAFFIVLLLVPLLASLYFIAAPCFCRLPHPRVYKCMCARTSSFLLHGSNPSLTVVHVCFDDPSCHMSTFPTFLYPTISLHLFIAKHGGLGLSLARTSHLQRRNVLSC